MFQRAVGRDRQIERWRQPDIAPKQPASTPGRRTLTQSLPAQSEPCSYTHAVESATRELRAVRGTGLPALIAALRQRDQVASTRASIQVRHLLMSANAHVRSLEKGAWFTDPMVQFLRHDLETLTARASKVGAYRGLEHLKPTAYVDPSEKRQSPPIRVKPELRVARASRKQKRAA